MFMVPFKRREDWLDPFGDLEKLQDEMDRLFDFPLGRPSDRGIGPLERAWRPAVDIRETKDSVVVRADLPGLTKEDIEVTVQGNALIIKGEKKQERETKEEGLVRMERASGSFYRAMALPREVDSAQVKAVYKDGVLELTLPKKEESKPKQISIEVK